MTTHVVTEAQMIRAYRAPEYLVEPVGDESGADDISSINDEWGFDLVDASIRGWGYEAIIKVRIPGEDQFYLANLAHA